MMTRLRYGAALLVDRDDWSTVGDLARAIEDSGWDYAFCAEGPYGGNSNAIVGSTVLAESSTRIRIGSCIAIIYLRHPWLMTVSAGNLQERSGGRFVLGLGVSHPAINEPLGIQTNKPVDDARKYVAAVRGYMSDLGVSFPIWLAAVNIRMARLAGEVADGVILHHVPLSLMPETLAAIHEGEERAGKGKSTLIAAYARIALTTDRRAAEAMGRAITYEFLKFPVYQKLFIRAGYAEATNAIVAAIAAKDKEKALDLIPDVLLRDYLIMGPRQDCEHQLELYRSAGVDVLLFAPLPMSGVPLMEKYRPLLEAFKVPESNQSEVAS